MSPCYCIEINRLNKELKQLNKVITYLSEAETNMSDFTFAKNAHKISIEPAIHIGSISDLENSIDTFKSNLSNDISIAITDANTKKTNLTNDISTKTTTDKAYHERKKRSKGGGRSF